MIVGICGKSGSGKSTLAREISNIYNGVYLDIDKVGHDVLLNSDVKCELINCFGSQVVSDDKVDRKKLGDKVFNSRNEMDKLTNITWKYMQEIIDNFLSVNKDKLIILDWILLSKTKYFEMCDIKILLDIPFQIRKDRAIKRDGITSDDFDLRDRASEDFSLSDFDYVIHSNDEIDVKGLVKKYD